MGAPASSPADFSSASSEMSTMSAAAVFSGRESSLAMSSGPTPAGSPRVTAMRGRGVAVAVMAGLSWLWSGASAGAEAGERGRGPAGGPRRWSFASGGGLGVPVAGGALRAARAAQRPGGHRTGGEQGGRRQDGDGGAAGGDLGEHRALAQRRPLDQRGLEQRADDQPEHQR